MLTYFTVTNTITGPTVRLYRHSKFEMELEATTADLNELTVQQPAQ